MPKKPKKEVVDWTLGPPSKCAEPMAAALLNIKQVLQCQVQLCHDLMDQGSWQRKDPIAHLAECYRMAAIGLGYLDQAMALYSKRTELNSPPDEPAKE